MVVRIWVHVCLSVAVSSSRGKWRWRLRPDRRSHYPSRWTPGYVCHRFSSSAILRVTLPNPIPVEPTPFSMSTLRHRAAALPSFLLSLRFVNVTNDDRTTLWWLAVILAIWPTCHVTFCTACDEPICNVLDTHYFGLFFVDRKVTGGPHITASIPEGKS